MNKDQESELKISEGRLSSLSNSSSSNSNSSKSSTIHELLQSEESKRLVAEIDDRISHLIDFIKSKKYTEKRKKYYAKKIVDRIIDKYTDDTVDTVNFGHGSLPTSTPYDIEKEKKYDKFESKDVRDETAKSSKPSASDTLSNIKDIEIDKKSFKEPKRSEKPSPENLIELESPKSTSSDDIPKELSLTSPCGDSVKEFEVLEKVKSLKKELEIVETPKPPFSARHVEKTVKQAEIIFSKLEQKVSEFKESLSTTKENDSTLTQDKINAELKTSSKKSESTKEVPETLKSSLKPKKIDKKIPIKSDVSTKYTDLLKKDNKHPGFQTIRDLTPRTLCEVYKLEFSDTSSHKTSPSSDEKLDSKSVSQKDWKFYKTDSEKLFEFKNRKDLIIHFAKKEKNRQISWINNEIKCLTKLKNLLEQSCSTEATDTSTSLSPNSLKDGNKTLEEINFCLDELRKILREKKIQKSDSGSTVIETPIQEIKYESKNSSSSNASSTSYKKIPAHKPTDFELKYFQNSSDISNKENSDISNLEFNKKSVEIQTTPKISEDVSIQTLFSANNNINGSKNTITSGKSIAYFLTFEQMKNSFENNFKSAKSLEKVTVKIPSIPKQKLSTDYLDLNLDLQECLLKNRGDFVKAAEWRRQCINDMIFMRDKKYDEIDRQLLFTTKQMRKLTNRKYQETDEVKNKIKSKKNQLQKVFNRQVASVFSKKLQEKTLKGEVTLSTRKTIVLL